MELFDLVAIVPKNAPNYNDFTFPDDQIKIIPALYFKWLEKKNYNQNIENIGYATAGAVSMVVGVGELGIAIKAGNYLKTIMPAAEVLFGAATSVDAVSNGAYTNFLQQNLTQSQFSAYKRVETTVNLVALYKLVRANYKVVSTKLTSVSQNLYDNLKTSSKFYKDLKSQFPQKYNQLKNYFQKTLGKNIDEIENSLNFNLKFSNVTIANLNGFVDNLQTILNKHKLNGRNLTIEEFKHLVMKSTDYMSSNEKDFVNSIRNEIPMPNSNTIIQKVIPIGQRNTYFMENNDGSVKRISGYLSSASDSKHLNNYQDYFDGLRLDYQGSEFVSQNSNECIVIRFQAENPEVIEIPRNYNNGGNINNPNDPSPYNKDAPPFTGNGFTAGQNNTLGVPEIRADFNNPLVIKDGAEMYLIGSNQPILIGVYNKTLKKFVKP